MVERVTVSVLVPIYNVERYLGRCLDSIFSQTYREILYVFVDNNSTDKSLLILEDKIRKYGISPKKYQIVRHEKNEGIAVSRNDCVDYATSDYVLFVDSDDWIEPDMVEQMVKASKNGTVDIIGCNFFQEYWNGDCLYVKEPYADNCYENMLKALDYEVSSVLWKLLIRRSLFHKVRFTPHLDIVEDYIVTIKLYHHASTFAYVTKGLYHYILYQDSTSSRRLKSIQSHIKGVIIVEDYLKQNGLYDEHVKKRLLLRKFNIKSNFLTKSLLDYKAYQETFPEALNMWREMGYSKKECVKFWLADHNMFFLLNLIQRF